MTSISRARSASLLPLLFAALFVLSPSPARACLWDQDTVWIDATYMQDVLSVLVGRFPINPPLYYEMRLQRKQSELARNPKDLAAYDDAGVASDRLDKPDDAIAWMDKKKAQLDALPEGDANKKEHLYRYLSNQGTFYFHLWLKNGAAHKDLSDIQKARQLLGDALKLNPSAHFGRERYQVLVMDWLLKPKKSLDTLEIPRMMDESDSPDGAAKQQVIPSFFPDLSAKFAKTNVDEAAVRGLAGLIALGGSWESVDVIHNLALVLRRNRKTALAAVASLRAWELVDEGKKSLFVGSPASLKPVVGLQLGTFSFEGRSWEEIQNIFGKISKADYRKLKGKELIAKQYYALRGEARAWQDARTQFMLGQLKAGKHPDTHPDFWTGFTEPAMPLLKRAKQDPKLDLLSEFDGKRPAPAGSAGKK